MSDNDKQYIVSNRAVPLTPIISEPINNNWQTLEDAVNNNFDLIETLNAEKGSANGIATLDDSGTLRLEQIPEEAVTHIYSVDSKEKRDSLKVNPGDIVVVQDNITNKTYAYSPDPEGILSPWIEIATKNGGGTVAGNTCYVRQVLKEDWTEDKVNDNFYLQITDTYHGQGAIRYLLVNIKREDGRKIDCDYSVDENGTVKITSDLPFTGRLMISNLSGNVKNASFIPYCVLEGNRENNIPSLFITRGSTFQLVTKVPIIFVDGYNIARRVTSITSNVTKNVNPQDETEKPKDTSGEYVKPGEYIIFIDSEDIELDINLQDSGLLTDIKLTKKEDYIGIVEELPDIGVEGQRCYKIYDKSYEFKNNNWVPKPFTPIGQIIIEEDMNIYIDNLITYPYRQNNIDVNTSSTCFDYLMGSEIKGLDVNLQQDIIIEPGTCYGTNRIIKLNESIQRNLIAWGKNMRIGYPESNTGCIDLNSFIIKATIYEVTRSNTTYYVTTPGLESSYVEEGAIVYKDTNLTEANSFIARANTYMYNGTSYPAQDRIRNGWGNIFIISRPGFSDVLLSFSSSPVLPLGYTEYRRIGYFYREPSEYIDLTTQVDTHILKQKEINKAVYFSNPISFEINTEEINNNLVPEGTSMIVNVKSQELTDIEFYSDDILLYSGYTRNVTLELPRSFTTNIENLEFKLLGYKDERLL